MSRCNESIKAPSTTNYSEMLDRTGRSAAAAVATAVNSSREQTATALCASTTADKRTDPPSKPTATLKCFRIRSLHTSYYQSIRIGPRKMTARSVGSCCLSPA